MNAGARIPEVAAPAAASARNSAASAKPVGVGILGASGYGGVELIRLLAAHPHAELRAAGSRQFAGQPLGRVWPALGDAPLVLDDDPADPRAWLERGVEVVFAALPHGAFAARAAAFLEAGLRVIDLSSDFRLRDASEYARRYGAEHPSQALLEHSVYGLTEWCGPELDSATLVANPGCYATAVLLATLPAIEAGWWDGAPVVINALSGVSGAGRAPSLATHFVECGNGAAPYKVGEVHAHLGEIQQALRRAAPADSRAVGGELPLLFSPHLVPMARGIVASIALPMARTVAAEEAQALYRARYSAGTCIRVLAGDALPATQHVVGSNRCDMALRAGANGRVLLVYAALDNLGKGAAGQAVQNWNRMQGWAETTGLPLRGWVGA
jgi:N-acetyl-gamma-glutamyl-phosphate reductase